MNKGIAFEKLKDFLFTLIELHCSVERDKKTVVDVAIDTGLFHLILQRSWYAVEI